MVELSPLGVVPGVADGDGARSEIGDRVPGDGDASVAADAEVFEPSCGADGEGGDAKAVAGDGAVEVVAAAEAVS